MTIIRLAETNDSPCISGLLHQLGYELSPARVAAGLVDLRQNAADNVLIAQRDDKVIGCISLHVLPMFHTGEKLGRITAFVIDGGCRGQGIGHSLLKAAEAWFTGMGCSKIELTSGDRRHDAHRFYEREGYARVSQRFAKDL